MLAFIKSKLSFLICLPIFILTIFCFLFATQFIQWAFFPGFWLSPSLIIAWLIAIVLNIRLIFKLSRHNETKINNKKTLILTLILSSILPIGNYWIWKWILKTSFPDQAKQEGKIVFTNGKTILNFAIIILGVIGLFNLALMIIGYIPSISKYHRDALSMFSVVSVIFVAFPTIITLVIKHKNGIIISSDNKQYTCFNEILILSVFNPLFFIWLYLYVRKYSYVTKTIIINPF